MSKAPQKLLALLRNGQESDADATFELAEKDLRLNCSKAEHSAHLECFCRYLYESSFKARKLRKMNKLEKLRLAAKRTFSYIAMQSKNSTVQRVFISYCRFLMYLVLGDDSSATSELAKATRALEGNVWEKPCGLLMCTTLSDRFFLGLSRLSPLSLLLLSRLLSPLVVCLSHFSSLSHFYLISVSSLSHLCLVSLFSCLSPPPPPPPPATPFLLTFSPATLSPSPCTGTDRGCRKRSQRAEWNGRSRLDGHRG